MLATGVARAGAAAGEGEVIVYTNLTEEGKKLTPPTREHPSYYVLIPGGYRQEGATVAGEKPPPPNAVAKLVHAALVKQNYRPAMQKGPPPDQYIVVHWGYINPDTLEAGDPENPRNVTLNQREMVALVAGNSISKMDPFFMEFRDVMDAASEDRYFVVVSSFDFAAASATPRKKVLLWRARMSVPSAGFTLDEVLGALVASGGPLFGRQTEFAKHVWTRLVPEGHVRVGTPTEVKDTKPTPGPAK